MTLRNSAWAEGNEAAKQGKQISSNPYSASYDSTSYRAWENGWCWASGTTRSRAMHEAQRLAQVIRVAVITSTNQDSPLILVEPEIEDLFGIMGGDDNDPDFEIRIKYKKMTRGEYESLPEFEG